MNSFDQSAEEAKKSSLAQILHKLVVLKNLLQMSKARNDPQ